MNGEWIEGWASGLAASLEAVTGVRPEIREKVLRGDIANEMLWWRSAGDEGAFIGVSEGDAATLLRLRTQVVEPDIADPLGSNISEILDKSWGGESGTLTSKAPDSTTGAQMRVAEFADETVRFVIIPVGAGSKPAAEQPAAGKSAASASPAPPVSAPSAPVAAASVPAASLSAASLPDATGDSTITATSANLAQMDSILSSAANLDMLMDIEMPVTLRFGTTHMSLRDLTALNAGSVIEFDRGVDEPVEVMVNGRVVARGEAVVVQGSYGVRISEIASRSQRQALISN